MEDMEKLNDEALVRLVCDKDQELFTEIVRRYESRLLRYAMSIVKDNTKSQDVVQNAFIKAFTNLRGFNQKLKFSSWIYRITHNEAINEIKKYHKEMSLEDMPEMEMIRSSEKGADEQFDADQERETVKKFLDALPMQYREPLYLYHIEERSYKEISDILRIPMGTVATRINRGKNMLKEKLSKEFKKGPYYGQTA